MKRGRKRLDRCRAGHLLTDASRRWKVYTRADGSTCLLSNGCRHCNNDKTAAYKRSHAVDIKAKRLGIAS